MENLFLVCPQGVIIVNKYFLSNLVAVFLDTFFLQVELHF